MVVLLGRRTGDAAQGRGGGSASGLRPLSSGQASNVRQGFRNRWSPSDTSLLCEKLLRRTSGGDDVVGTLHAIRGWPEMPLPERDARCSRPTCVTRSALRVLCIHKRMASAFAEPNPTQKRLRRGRPARRQREQARKRDTGTANVSSPRRRARATLDGVPRSCAVSRSRSRTTSAPGHARVPPARSASCVLRPPCCEVS